MKNIKYESESINTYIADKEYIANTKVYSQHLSIEIR